MTGPHPATLTMNSNGSDQHEGRNIGANEIFFFGLVMGSCKGGNQG